ncbi:hypothetical protein [Candidatus Nitrosotalea okcheonensis]|uniref:Uncharacterized protein n=1 Tax=Candidatus Nitrosotalea okcheonensis TaxID=1903276 RepID=A0A2H1FG60_9ARCH|nr:hypothetical protein [Candidatus Nitrosotalea okcheonensis]MDE1729042.1 hypothetical protein [Nitrososphaerota archaeon]MDH2907029.1 hypothetical protein [Candidatus Nitrosotalea sp.]SMH71755.1 protein of unknown function [Candidatus Nitrosotalea okcheonensis]
MGNRKRISEIMKMSKEELYQYLRQEDNTIQSTDKIEMKPFEHGIKIFYFHKDSEKPYKTKVYLNPEESESLK